MKVRIAYLLALALVPALMLGCGDDPEMLVQPPDTTPPLAPVLDGAGGMTKSVGVWWESNTEPDLRGYYVYVVENGQTSRVNESPTRETYYVVQVDNPGTVQIYVTAVDLSGNESGPSSSRNVKADQVGRDDAPDRQGPDYSTGY